MGCTPDHHRSYDFKLNCIPQLRDYLENPIFLKQGLRTESDHIYIRLQRFRMKRLKSNGGVSRPRQDPVSCLLCRSKKLRCDRQQPCSNCSTRGNTCEFITQAGRQPQERKTPAPAAGSDEVLARLKRLEDEVATLRGKPLLPVHPSQQPSPPAVNLPKDSTDEEHRAAFEWLEGIGTANNSSVGYSSNYMF